jgi:AcrR family transcriptional regulator
MTDAVKGRRSYHSPRRQQQAAATRQRILESAQPLFEQQGYAATTMGDVAAEADVSLKTVYLAFETKARLLRALWDLLLKGDQDETSVADRSWYRQVLEEPDPRQQLQLVAGYSRDVKMRIGGILKVIRSAAPLDPDSDELWRLIQTDFHDNQRVIVQSLAAKKALRRGLGVTKATDILWTLNHPDVWLLLVGERLWTPAQFEKWFFETACDQLLRRPTG